MNLVQVATNTKSTEEFTYYHTELTRECTLFSLLSNIESDDEENRIVRIKNWKAVVWQLEVLRAQINRKSFAIVLAEVDNENIFQEVEMFEIKKDSFHKCIHEDGQDIVFHAQTKICFPKLFSFDTYCIYAKEM